MKENLIGLNALIDSFFEYRREIIKLKIKIYAYYIFSLLCVLSLIPVWKLLNFGNYNNLILISISLFVISISFIIYCLTKPMNTMLTILRKKMLEIFESVFCLRKIIKKEDVDIILLNAIDLKLFLIAPDV